MLDIRVLSALFAVAVGVMPAQVDAYSVSMTNKNSGKIVRWNKTTLPFWLHPSCSTDVATAGCLAECRASFKTWEGHACSTLAFADQGMSSSKQLTAVGFNANDKNEVAWIENNAWTYGKFVLGVTSPYFYTTGSQAGAITEADIAMNGYQQTWAISGKAFTTDVRNVLVHEIGHFFGLQHNLYPNSSNPETMAPTADNYLKSQTPEQDDINGLCYLYPKAGSYPCKEQKDCPYVNVDGPQGEYYAGQISCNSGACGGTSAPIQQGGGKLGDACQNAIDCDKPLFCQPLSGAQAVCSQNCNPQSSGSCPAGFACYAYQNQPTNGACIKGQTGGATKKNVGDTCADHAECKTQMCLALDGKLACQQPCTSDSQCGTGQKCGLFQGKTYGACTADTGGTTPTKKGVGQVCFASSECSSGLCVGNGGNSGLCTQSCGSGSACPSGKACVQLQSGKGACLDAGSTKIGDACSKSSDCADGMCVASAGKYVCTKACSKTSDCPTTYDCYSLSSGAGGCFKGPSKQPDGGKCQGSTDCNSGLCVGDAGADGACVQPCAGDSQCQNGYTCSSLSGGGGFCEKLGDKALGDACGKDTDCASGDCVGLGGKFVCVATCTAPVDCPCGFECTTFQSGSKYCAAGKKLACVADGGGCSDDGECTSDKCVNSLCVPTCSIFSGDALCPNGKGCVRLEAGKPLGVCSTKGPGDFGAKCGNDTFCKALFCHKGLCTKSCNPFGPNACGFGLVCEVADGEVGRCTVPTSTAPDAGASGGGDAQTSDAAGSGSSSGGSSSGSSSSDTTSSDTSASGSSSGGGSSGAADAGSSGGATDGAAANPPIKVPLSGGSDSSGCSASTTGGSSPWHLAVLALGLIGILTRRQRRADRP